MLQLQLQLQLPVWLSDQGMLCALKFTRKKLLESGWTFFPTTLLLLPDYLATMRIAAATHMYI